MYILCIFEQMTQKSLRHAFLRTSGKAMNRVFGRGRVGMHSPNNAQGIKVVGYGYKKYYDKEINR